MRQLKKTFGLMLLVCLWATCAIASNPLEPPNTSSPRDTLRSFILATDALSLALQEEEQDRDVVWAHWNRAVRCFNLTEVPPSIAEDIGLESVLRLREILDRIEVPSYELIPDKADMNALDITRWRLPHTEIAVSKVSNGEFFGAYLFTPGTVDRLDEYYEAVRDMPYLSGDTQGLYEDYIYASGWMIPDGVLDMLPGWMNESYAGHAVWKWIGFVLVFVLVGGAVFLLMLLYMAWRKKRPQKGMHIDRLFLPVVGMGACSFAEYMLKAQVNMTGKVLSVTCIALEGVYYLCVAWGIVMVGNVIVSMIISTRRIKEDALDADVIKLVGRLISLGLVFMLFFYVGSHFGLPVTAVFASAGIMGMAVALAARETLSNFFGGVSIFMDRPFRAGDYIVLDTGERGQVKAVGMRSTRLLTRDGVLITVPNAIITSVKIVNQSAPYPHFRIRIPVGVAYGTDFETVEKILLDIANSSDRVKRSPKPSVRFSSFGESAINLELRVWAITPEERGRTAHRLSKEIYRRFSEEKISIPFPQAEVRIKNADAD